MIHVNPEYIHRRPKARTACAVQVVCKLQASTWRLLGLATFPQVAPGDALWHIEGIPSPHCRAHPVPGCTRMVEIEERTEYCLYTSRHVASHDMFKSPVYVIRLDQP